MKKMGAKGIKRRGIDTNQCRITSVDARSSVVPRQCDALPVEQDKRMIPEFSKGDVRDQTKTSPLSEQPKVAPQTRPDRAY